MKVLFITTAYPSDHLPGAGVFHQTQAESIRDLGVDIEVVAPVPYSPKVLSRVSQKYKNYKKFPQGYEWNGIKIHRPRFVAIPGQLKWAQPHKRFAKAIQRYIEDQGIKFDIIHAHFAMPSGGAAAILSNTYKKPYVLTLHGSDVNVYPQYSNSAMNAFKFAVKNAGTVTAVSGALADKTQKLTGVKPEVLPIGVNMERFSGTDISEEEKISLRKHLNLPEDKKLLLFVGRIMNEKGIREMVSAIEQLDDRFRLVLVGDGPLKSELEGKEKIILTGQVANERVKDYLRAADIFLLPSYREGMPTVIIEALALKVPVLSSNVGGIPELFGEHKGLLIEPKSSEQIVNGVLEYTNKGRYGSEVIESLFERVTSNFDVTQNSKDLIQIYRNLL
ncbi:glycosyltransferase family 4 protein [Sutcliffiella horikoshii]|uniref:Glycosyltransferase family 4 protein n=1 Tax=Sutcliffiella horikoshii TaxID=79883 RepID=A0AA94WSG5_9BACI|nr:glycosyltransferase [Sutcliffiella horikoshii]TYS59954.1 glycosyltransferase family 4 protein [Sutcliffiella horikoshii]